MMIFFPFLAALFLKFSYGAVNLDSGYMSLHFEDILFKVGEEQLLFSRTYNSNEKSISPLGKGMALRLGSKLSFSDSKILFHPYGLSEAIEFRNAGKNKWHSISQEMKLTKVIEGWALEGKQELYLFNEKGKLQEFSGANGGLKFSWSNEKLLSINDKSGNPVLRIETNDDNLITKITNNNKESCSYSYDSEKRLTKFTAVNGKHSDYRYGPFGLEELIQDGKQIIKVSYSKNGRVISYLEASGKVTTIKERISLENGLEKQVLSVVIKDANNEETLTRENYFRRVNKRKILKRKIEKSKNSYREIVYSDNEHSRPVLLVKDQVRQEVSYDKSGRVTESKHSSLGKRRYSYDDKGQLISVEENGNAYRYLYSNNKIVSVQGPQEEILSRYHKGNPISLVMKLPKKESYEITYDSSGRMEKLHAGKEPILKIVYDKNNEVKDIIKADSRAMDIFMKFRNRYEYLFLILPQVEISGHF